jgi:hypothetical protein
MTKNEYLQLRKAGSVQIVYEYYKERFDGNKHRPFLPPNEFAVYLQMYMNVPKVFERVCNHYDQLFNVIVLKDKNEQFISFL